MLLKEMAKETKRILTIVLPLTALILLLLVGISRAEVYCETIEFDIGGSHYQYTICYDTESGEAWYE